MVFEAPAVIDHFCAAALSMRLAAARYEIFHSPVRFLAVHATEL